jgi:hypothetical protein
MTFKKWWKTPARFVRLRRNMNDAIDRALDAKRAFEHWSLCSATETDKDRSDGYFARAQYYLKTYRVQRSRAFQADKFLRNHR